MSQEMLEEIFNNIKENEIVMPDEQKGLVRRPANRKAKYLILVFFVSPLMEFR